MSTLHGSKSIHPRRKYDKFVFNNNYRFSSSDNKQVQSAIISEIVHNPDCKFSERDTRSEFIM